MASAIDPTKPVAGNPTTESVRLNFAAAKSEIEILQQTAGVGPQGPIGPQGPSGTITVGSVTTGPAGGNASVTNTGTPQAATLNFTLPRGDSGTGGSGITEAQAVEAVRIAHPNFEEVPVTTAVEPAAPNIAEPPQVNAGWTPADGSGPTDTFNHTSGTGVLAYPLTGSVSPGQWIQVTMTIVNNRVPPAAPNVTAMPTLVTVYLRTAPTVTTGQLIVGAAFLMAASSLVVQVPNTGTATFPYLVVVPATTFDGTFTLTSVLRRNGVLNSSSFEIKGLTVVTRGTSLGIGGGLTTCTGGTDTAFGSLAGQKLTIASNSSFFGANSGSNLTSGSGNTGLGTAALGGHYIGNNNVAVGYAAMQVSVSGSSNVAVGWCSGQHNRAGSDNTSVGYVAFRYPYATTIRNVAIGSSSLMNKRFGDDTTAVGAFSGAYSGAATTALNSSSRSVYLGAYTRASANDPTNEIVIGYNAIGHGSHTITLGNGDITALHCNVQTISAISDSRVKEQVGPADLDRCLDTVKGLPVSRWGWQPIAGVHLDKHVTGFLAEDVAKIFPKAVTRTDEYLVVRDANGDPEMTTATEIVEGGVDEQEEPPHVEIRTIEKTQEFKGLQRIELTEALPTLWGAVQKLIQKNEELEKQLAELKPAGEPKPAAEVKPAAGGGVRRK